MAMTLRERVEAVLRKHGQVCRRYGHQQECNCLVERVSLDLLTCLPQPSREGLERVMREASYGFSFHQEAERIRQELADMDSKLTAVLYRAKILPIIEEFPNRDAMMIRSLKQVKKR